MLSRHFLEVPGSSQEREPLCVYVLRLSILPHSAIFNDMFCLFIIPRFNILCIMFRIKAYKAAPFTRLCVSVYILHVLLPCMAPSFSLEGRLGLSNYS
jgi:hypothetical protein